MLTFLKKNYIFLNVILLTTKRGIMEDKISKREKPTNVKTYKIKIEEYEDGRVALSRRNMGFTPVELLGLCNLISMEVSEQMRGTIKPDIITREVVVEDNK